MAPNLRSRSAEARCRYTEAVTTAARRIEVWVQVITGMALDDGGAVRVLDAKEWHQRKQRLEELGGPPLP